VIRTGALAGGRSSPIALATLDGAMARHPAAHVWSPDLARASARLGDRLRERGLPWPETAAAVLTARGASGLETGPFATVTGVDPGVLARLESGELAPVEVPAAVRRWAAVIDWASLDLEVDRG